MPYIIIYTTKGRPIEQKHKLAEAVTEAVSKTLEIDKNHVRIVIHNVEKSDWYHAGEQHS